VSHPEVLHDFHEHMQRSQQSLGSLHHITDACTTHGNLSQKQTEPNRTEINLSDTVLNKNDVFLQKLLLGS